MTTIQGRRRTWIESPIHQQIRNSVITDSSPNCQDFDLESYLTFQRLHFSLLIKLYYSNFSSDYRRKSSRLSFDITEDLVIGAYATAGNSEVINITQGVILSIEDAAHALFSDPHSFLIHGDDSGVIRLPNHNALDEFRFGDYKTIRSFVDLSAQLGSPIKHYPSVLFKFISMSRHRQDMADFVSGMSLLWIFGHEDAHSYLGHLKHFSDALGASPDGQSNLFSELVSGLFEQEYPKERQAAEFNADRNAAVQLVDYMMDSEFFVLVPALQRQADIFQSIPQVQELNLSDAQVKFICLLRLVSVSVMLSLAIFERNVVKKNGDTSFYPGFGSRCLSALIVVFTRSIQVATLHPERGLQGENNMLRFIPFVVHLLCSDLQDVLRNILFNGYILEDSSFPAETDTEVLGFRLDDSITTDLSFLLLSTVYENFRDRSPTAINQALKNRVVFREFINEFRNSLSIHSSIFSMHQIQENPSILGKVLETLEHEKMFIAHLEDILAV